MVPSPFQTGQTAGADQHRRLFVFNGGFFRQKRLRRILHLSGYDVRLGLPKGPDDCVGVWGHSPTAHRGERMAARYEAPLLRVEDAFIRSLMPGRAGEPPLGLTVDFGGMHYDPAQPSDLEQLLASHPLDDTALLNRARGAIERLKESHLSKYFGFDPSAPCPEPGYVLVIDQTREDASVTCSGAGRAEFLEMLVFAQQEHPGERILIKTHPETQAGHRRGHFLPEDESKMVRFLSDPVSPWVLLEGASAVYTVSSQMGFEAIFAGHRPRVFGQPFYAGWGLTEDDRPVTRRQRRLSRAQLFAAAMILYPKWYDPHGDCLCTLERVIDIAEAQARAWREDHKGWVASGIRLWKRGAFGKVFGQHRTIQFTDHPAKIEEAMHRGARHLVWAARRDVPRTAATVQVEDGFLRSRGLGAALTPPLSLVLDDLGIYYDPTRASRLEQLILSRRSLRPDQELRAERLIKGLTEARLSKYNLGGAATRLALPDGYRILVPGQVEDDASIILGTKRVQSNLALLEETRAAHPEAVILYKPHPDVEAGLRPGALPEGAAERLADAVLHGTDAADALDQVDAVWTMTSLLGFEALLRGLPVTCLGAPFYAGWGLTTDLGTTPARRGASVSLAALVHACLIEYPRYFDPITQSACPVEVVAERLAVGTALPRPPSLRALARLQGLLASQAHRWR